jgi:hypothetical protein
MKHSINLRSFKVIAAVAIFAFVVNSCEVDDLLNGSLEDLEGEWLCAENSTLFGSNNFTVYISVNPSNTSEIIIDNFYGVGIGVIASVSGSDITISNYTEEGNTVNGDGFISGNRKTITLSYSVADSGGAPNECTATYTKQ